MQTFIAEGLPMTLSPDDPALWGAHGVSYDWAAAFVSFDARAGLATLKQLAMNSIATVRAALGRLSALSVSLCKSISGLYGAFVWARRALNSQKRRVSGPGRARSRRRSERGPWHRGLRAGTWRSTVSSRKTRARAGLGRTEMNDGSVHSRIPFLVSKVLS
jgi:hypothetical protein